MFSFNAFSEAPFSSLAGQTQTGSVSVTGSATLASKGSLTGVFATSVSGSATLSSKGSADIAGKCSLSGSASLSTQGTETVSGATLATGPASLTSVIAAKISGISALSCSASVSSDSEVSTTSSFSLSSSATLASAISAIVTGACTPSSTWQLTSDGVAVEKDKSRFFFIERPNLQAKPAVPVVGRGTRLSDNLLGAWPFYEKYGSIVRDINNTGHNLSLNNMDSDTDWEDSEKGLALHLDGSSEYLSLSENITLAGEFSFSWWMKANLHSDWQAIIGLTSNSHSLYIRPHGGTLYLEGGTDFSDLTSRVNLGNWQHFVLTRDANNIVRLYVDTIKDSHEPEKDVSVDFTGFGRPGSYHGEYLRNGYLTNAALFNRALHQTEVEELYSNPFGIYSPIKLTPHFNYVFVGKSSVSCAATLSSSLTTEGVLKASLSSSASASFAGSRDSAGISLITGPASLSSQPYVDVSAKSSLSSSSSLVGSDADVVITSPTTLSGSASISSFGGRIITVATSLSASMPVEDGTLKTIKPALPVLNLAHRLSQGLAAVWPMYEGTGTTVRDISLNKNNGSFKLLTEDDWEVDEKGVCLDFDGTEYVEIPYSSSLNSENITVSAWINATVGSSLPLQMIFHGPDQSYQFYMSGSSLAAWMNINGTWQSVGSSAGGINAGQWQHVAVTYDGSRVKFYVDGQLKKQSSRPGSLSSGSGKAYIGSEKGAYTFDGKISDVRVYNKALNDQDILDSYLLPFDIYASKRFVWDTKGATLSADGKLKHSSRASMSCSSSLASKDSAKVSGISLTTGPASLSVDHKMVGTLRAELRGSAYLSNLFRVNSSASFAGRVVKDLSSSLSSSANMSGNGVLLTGALRTSLSGIAGLVSDHKISGGTLRSSLSASGNISPLGSLIGKLQTSLASSAGSVSALLNIKSNDVVLFTLYINQTTDKNLFVDRSPEFTSYIMRELQKTLYIEQVTTNNLHVDREVEFTLER